MKAYYLNSNTKNKTNKLISIALLFLLIANSANVNVLAMDNQEQANEYGNIAHQAYKKRDFKTAGEYYEKAYKEYQIPAFKRNYITAYLSYSFDLANDRKFEDSIKYCNKVLEEQPNNPNAKELMADILLARAADYFYIGNLDAAKQTTQASLTYATLEEQKQSANELLAQIESSIKSGQQPVPKYQAQPDSSIPDSVNRMETKVFGQANNKLALMDRIKILETQVLGQSFDQEGLIIRVDRLKRALIPEEVSHLAGNPENYIQEIYEQSKGQVNVFGYMPIKVYISRAKVKPYHKSYEKAVREALKEWEKASNNKLKFSVLYDPQKADIYVTWQESFEDFAWRPMLKTDDIAAKKKKMQYQKANMLVRTGSMIAMLAGGLLGVPVVGTLGYAGGSVASPVLQYKAYGTNVKDNNIKINTKVTEGLTKEQAKQKIKQIAMHQIGHAIGIYGHSPDPNDIMYRDFTANSISKRDENTIQEIYRRVKFKKKKSIFSVFKKEKPSTEENTVEQKQPSNKAGNEQ